LAVLSITALWSAPSCEAKEAVGEYFRLTTVVTMPLSAGWRLTDRGPPPGLMQIVEDQRRFYHLKLQKVTVFRATGRVSFGDSDFDAQAFDEQTREKCGQCMWVVVRIGFDGTSQL